MNKEIGNWIFPLVIMGASLMLTNCKKEVTKKNPVITWANPADITEGTLLSGTQLNATADVPGTFVYTPAIGTKLDVGCYQDLKVDFTPSAVDYNFVTKTVIINVIQLFSLTPPVFNNTKTYGTMTDQDGNVYKTIAIGTQTWMAENLRTTRYRDGTSIPNVTDNTAWRNLTTGAYCNYNNTKSADTIATYGRLYNWYAATDSLNIAPTGWHVPTDVEWTKLTTYLYLGGEIVAGGKMKEAGMTHWESPNIGATNESGFTGLPSGFRLEDSGGFSNLGYNSFYWSSTQCDFNSAWFYNLEYIYAGYNRACYPKGLGYSVRLVMD
jgi:uncharacterized protein (TIGR02145 family)